MDNLSLLKEQYAAQKEYELSQLKNAYDKNVQALDEKAAAVPAQYEAAKNELAVQNAIARKNFKTYTISTIFILLFLTEPNFSKFYSVAPDGTLSREVREAIAETIKSSPLVYEYKETKRFKILRDYIMFKPTQTQYIPLSYSTSRMDGRLPSAFIADEVGALPNSYAINAMQSGQLNILNKIGFIISTKYPTAFSSPSAAACASCGNSVPEALASPRMEAYCSRHPFFPHIHCLPPRTTQV